MLCVAHKFICAKIIEFYWCIPLLQAINYRTVTDLLTIFMLVEILSTAAQLYLYEKVIKITAIERPYITFY